MFLTAKQTKVYEALKAPTMAGSTARQLADAMQTPNAYADRFTDEAVYGQLKALERKGKVRRLSGRPARWEAIA